MKEFEKIENLVKALKDIGIHAEIDYHAEWCCDDYNVHCGIEVYTDMDYGEDCWSFYFTPDGKYIKDLRDAPIRF